MVLLRRRGTNRLRNSRSRASGCFPTYASGHGQDGEPGVCSWAVTVSPGCNFRGSIEAIRPDSALDKLLGRTFFVNLVVKLADGVLNFAGAPCPSR